jgi:hypothetical protein
VQFLAVDAMDTARRSSIAGPSPSAQRRLTYSFQTLVSGPVGMHHSPFTDQPEKGHFAPQPQRRHSRPRTGRLCAVSAGPSASRPSLSAWAPKPITINHRGRQFFARACNRDGVFNPANSLERGLHGAQDGAMLGGVVAPERVDHNVCHERAPLDPAISVTSNNPPKLGIRGLTGMYQRLYH